MRGNHTDRRIEVSCGVVLVDGESLLEALQRLGASARWDSASGRVYVSIPACDRDMINYWAGAVRMWKTMQLSSDDSE